MHRFLFVSIFQFPRSAAFNNGADRCGNVNDTATENYMYGAPDQFFQSRSADGGDGLLDASLSSGGAAVLLNLCFAIR